jgi:putative transposase
VTIKCRKFWLWRAVDQNGLVLDEILQCRRNTKAAKRLLIRLMKKHNCTPTRFITPSRDIVAQCTAGQWKKYDPTVQRNERLYRGSHKGLNNRATSHRL